MFKTATGKEVKLKDITLSQRVECEDASAVGYDSAGGIVVHNIAKAGVKWACAGLGVANLAELERQGYTYSEIMEIGAEVQRLARLDPSAESGSS